MKSIFSMASFKADSYYETTVDDCVELSPSSDDDQPDVPKRHEKRYAQWVEEHTDALLEIYNIFIANGETCFGRAFFQTGTFIEFAGLVFKHTVPGGAN